MSIRSLDVCILALVADTELAWTPPAGLSIIDIQKDDAAIVRMGFVAGSTAAGTGTINGGAYFEIDPDWWNSGGKDISLSASSIFYFRSIGTTNTLRILIGVE